MEFYFTPEEEAFRQEVREFLRRELPTDWAIRIGIGSLGKAATSTGRSCGSSKRSCLPRAGWCWAGPGSTAGRLPAT